MGFEPCEHASLDCEAGPRLVHLFYVIFGLLFHRAGRGVRAAAPPLHLKMWVENEGKKGRRAPLGGFLPTDASTVGVCGGGTGPRAEQ